MSQIGAPVDDLALKRARHRVYEWCRLRNDFLDNPLWRVAATIAGLPLYQVQAFVVRLESLANRSDPRGYVGDFSPVEFGAAHGMATDEAARIFVALEHPDVGWVDQGHVVTFHPRNPDKEDPTSAERDRRRKARKWIRKELARRGRIGAIAAEDRDATEAMLELLPDPDLHELKQKLSRGVALEAALDTLSTSHAGHAVANRGSVAATPRAEQSRSKNSSAAVDNSGGATRVETTGLAEQEDPQLEQLTTDEAELWLAGEAVRILVERLNERRPRAELLIARWRRDLDDDPVATAALIAGLDDPRLNMARFEVLVGENIRRCRIARERGEPLPLPPVRNFGTDPLRVANPQAGGHAVAPVAVDNTPAQSPATPSQRSGTDG